MRRFISILIALVAIVAALAACQGGLPAGVVYPSISPTEGEPLAVSHSFTFEGTPVDIEVAVDGGIYEGATAAEKSVVRFGSARENDWIEDYYPAFVDEEHQESFYTDLLAALERVRDERGLDSDRFAELLAVFCQSLEYRTDPGDLSPKFPIETFVERRGDCDDKTLLLAALLAREGYDVVVMLFQPEQHVALGIRSADIGYKGTGYAFVETTGFSLVGQVPDELADGVILTSTPQLFRIGEGTTAYTAGAQVAEILQGRDRAIEEASELAAAIGAADAELADLQNEIKAARQKLDADRAAGRTDEYNAGVAPYNNLVNRYNAAVRERNRLGERYNQLAALEKAIVEGLTDRPGTHALVLATLE